MAKMDYTYVNADKYCAPGKAVPANKLGAEDTESLRSAVAEEIAARQAELAEIGGLGGSYKLDHLCAFHKFLFGNVFDWAGEVRDVDMSDPRFVKAADLEDEARLVFLRMENEDYFKGLEIPDMADRLAYYTREIDRLHPFVYGTKEALFVFFKQVLGRMRFNVAYESVSEDDWNEARDAGLNGDLSKYMGIYGTIITKIPREKKKKD